MNRLSVYHSINMVFLKPFLEKWAIISFAEYKETLSCMSDKGKVTYSQLIEACNLPHKEP